MGQAAPLQCSRCRSRCQSEWCGLGGNDLSLLTQAKVTNRYKAGQVIFYQGNPSLGLFCISAGMVVLRKTDAEGRSLIVRVAGRGQTLGYRAFFSEQEYAASAEASVDCFICWIDRTTVEKLIRRNPRLLVSFIRHISDDLAEAETARLQATTMSVRLRLVHFLLSLKDRDGTVDREGRINLDLKISRQDIAAMLGTTPETIARTTRQLSDAGIATFDRRKVIIPDLDRLLDEVEMLD